MSNLQWELVTLGDVTTESRKRAGDYSGFLERTVYGVDRSVGLTSVAKYAASSLERYKILEHGMFAYNPMRLNIGSIGYCSEDIQPGLVSPDYVVFECNAESLDPDFLSYYINSPEWKEWTASAGVGSVRMRIYYKELARLPLWLPPLHEQRAIAGLLGTLDDKIELNRRMNWTLESIARAVFNHFFMKFEPLGSNVASIPQGWKSETMENYCLVITRGVTPKYSPGSGRLIINQRANRGTELDWNELKELTLDLEVPNEKQANKYDVLVNSLGEGTLGRIHLFLEDWATMAVDQHMSICRTSSPAKSLYIYYLLSSSVGQDRIEAVKTGSTGMTMLNISKLREFHFLSPPDALLTRFANIALPIWNKITSNQKASHTLVSLRETLLPKLMRGEVRVR